jgi:hypothetical protein
VIECKGLAVRSPSGGSWPFDRAVLVVGEELRFARAPGRVARALGDQPVRHGQVRLMRHHVLHVWKTVLWLSVDPPVGFVPNRVRALKAALAERGWAVEVETTWRVGPPGKRM